MLKSPKLSTCALIAGLSSACLQNQVQLQSPTNALTQTPPTSNDNQTAYLGNLISSFETTIRILIPSIIQKDEALKRVIEFPVYDNGNGRQGHELVVKTCVQEASKYASGRLDSSKIQAFQDRIWQALQAKKTQINDFLPFSEEPLDEAEANSTFLFGLDNCLAQKTKNATDKALENDMPLVQEAIKEASIDLYSVYHSDISIPSHCGNNFAFK